MHCLPFRIQNNYAQVPQALAAPVTSVDCTMMHDGRTGSLLSIEWTFFQHFGFKAPQQP